MNRSVAIISFTPELAHGHGPGQYRVNVPIQSREGERSTTWYCCGGPAPSLAEALLDVMDRLYIGGESIQDRATGLSAVLSALEQGAVHVPSPMAQRVTQAFKESLSDLVEESKRKSKSRSAIRK